MTKQEKRESAVLITVGVVLLTFGLFAIASMRSKPAKADALMYMAVVIPSIIGGIVYDKLYPKNGSI